MQINNLPQATELISGGEAIEKALTPKPLISEQYSFKISSKLLIMANYTFCDLGFAYNSASSLTTPEVDFDDIIDDLLPLKPGK